MTFSIISKKEDNQKIYDNFMALCKDMRSENIQESIDRLMLDTAKNLNLIVDTYTHNNGEIDYIFK